MHGDCHDCNMDEIVQQCGTQCRLQTLTIWLLLLETCGYRVCKRAPSGAATERCECTAAKCLAQQLLQTCCARNTILLDRYASGDSNTFLAVMHVRRTAEMHDCRHSCRSLPLSSAHVKLLGLREVNAG